MTVSPVFFYGLFMDADALRSKGAHPANVRLAAVPGYSIRIGNRATLVREPGASAYGVLMDLPPHEIAALYSGPGLESVPFGARRGRRAGWCEDFRVVLQSRHAAVAGRAQ